LLTVWPSLQVSWPAIPIVFCETRELAEEWTYRYLAAAHSWAETAALDRIGVTEATISGARPAPPVAEVRAWARANGLAGSATKNRRGIVESSRNRRQQELRATHRGRCPR
jgi:hypothetical protein